MLLLVGLGNPGGEYLLNRHNIGFVVIEAIAVHQRFEPWHRLRASQAAVSTGRIGGVQTLLVKPETYMNESGLAVRKVADFYKQSINDITVFHDEIDLPPGKVRVKVGGSDAGHNGLRSISQHIGHNYRRVRVGVGHPGHRDLVQHYVLGDFSRAERPLFLALKDVLADNVGLLARGEDASFQNKVHLAMAAKGFGNDKGEGEDNGDKNKKSNDRKI
jgi:peptidyl-tRNA hydrolase, PTH1 family